MDKDREAQMVALEAKLPTGLIEPPKYLVELARNHKKLKSIRDSNKYK